MTLCLLNRFPCTRELKKLNELRKTDEVKFIKQFPLHPRDRLSRKRKEELDNYNKLSKKSYKTSSNSSER